MMWFLTATDLRTGNVRNKKTGNKKTPMPVGAFDHGLGAIQE
jgi:hypothetical protein